jgi:hypothetical protein
MAEAFKHGLNKLNMFRKEVGLEEIVEKWHNIYLDKETVMSVSWESWGRHCYCDVFYFLTRVIEPAHRNGVTFREIGKSFMNIIGISPMEVWVWKKRNHV